MTTAPARRVGVCIPAHNEAATLPDVLRRVFADIGQNADVLVVDDGSDDDTAAVARRAGARSLVASGSRPGRPVGKGRAMTTGLQAMAAEVIVFTDADVTDLHPRAITMLAAPLLHDPALVIAKATYARRLAADPDGGGRVNALLARPLLRRLRPELAHLQQPLAGEYAVRRSALTGLTLEPGYGVEMGLLLDVCDAFGSDAIVEVDLGSRNHRNRPLHELTGHADAILDAVLARGFPLPLRAVG